jgi:hypothetical protein
MASNDTVQKYFDSLIASYDILVDAVEKSNERGIKVSRQFAAEVVKGQREALELGKKFAAEPAADLGQLYTTLLDATTTAQGRAMSFAQAAYQEAISAGTDARETVTKLVEANQVTAKAAMEAAKSFSATNPFADALRQGFEAFQPKATKESKKEKAAV